MAEKLNPIYLLYGEPSLVEEFLSGLKDRVLSRGAASLNYHSYSATSMDAEEVLRAALTLPVFGGKRLVVVKDCHRMAERDRALFQSYAEEPAPDSCLVLLYGEDTPPAKDKLYTLLKKKGYVKELKSPRGRRLTEWIVSYVAQEGKQISPQAVGLLVEMCGEDFGTLKAELDKLILYKGGQKRIDSQDVESLMFRAEGANIFELTDAIGRKDLKGSVRVFSKLKDEEPVKVLGTLAWYVRLLIRCRELAGLNKEELSKRLSLPRFRVDSYREAASRFSTKRLHRLLLLLSEADRGLKGSPQRAEDILFRLLVEFCR